MKLLILRAALAAACITLASLTAAQSNSTAMLRVSTDSSTATSTDKTETRPTGKFSGIDLRAPADIVFSVAPNPSITVTGSADEVALLDTTVHDNVLTIALKHSVMQMKGLKLVITNPSLEAVNVAGSGSLQASDLNNKSFSINVKGSGSVMATGHAETVNVAIHGSGDVDVSAIHASAVNASVHGSGDLHAYASAAAIVDASGSGKVRISGKPATKVVNHSGSGSVSFE
jgi:hypothetical protein